MLQGVELTGVATSMESRKLKDTSVFSASESCFDMCCNLLGLEMKEEIKSVSVGHVTHKQVFGLS